MMKWIPRLFLVLALPLLLVGLPTKAEAAEPEFHAMWISSVYNLDYPSKKGLSAAQLQAEADSIIAYAKDTYVTDLFLQVRSCGDALYASDIFPWSPYLSGQAGVAPKGDFDPLAYFLEKGHAAGIRIHAWVNPYILTRQKADTREGALALLTADHPAREIPQAVVHHSNGQLYLDLGHPDARALILSGIQEILDKYDVDGIHFDDYFYPDSGFDDANTYALYGNGLSLAEFRRKSVNDFIDQVYTTVHKASEKAVFGISPSGIWANKKNNALGSDTSGKEAYDSMYADSRKWIKENMVDYLIPQIYWHMGHSSADFTTLANWWNAVAEGSKTKLYLGLGAYRMQEADKDPAWEGTAEIQRQLDLCRQLKNVSGVAFYRYGSCKTNDALTAVLKQYFTPKPEDPGQNQDPDQNQDPGQNQDPEFEDRLPAIKEAFTQKRLELVAPKLPVTVAAGGKLSLTVAAPSSSRVSAYYQGAACRLQGDICDYTGEIPVSGTPGSAPILLVCKTAGLVQVKLTPGMITVPETAAAVKGFSYTDDANSHHLTLNFDGPCGTDLLLEKQTLTLRLAPCRQAPLLEDPFFMGQRCSKDGTAVTHTFIMPQRVKAARTKWDGTTLQLILDLK